MRKQLLVAILALFTAAMTSAQLGDTLEIFLSPSKLSYVQHHVRDSQILGSLPSPEQQVLLRATVSPGYYLGGVFAQVRDLGAMCGTIRFLSTCDMLMERGSRSTSKSTYTQTLAQRKVQSLPVAVVPGSQLPPCALRR